MILFSTVSPFSNRNRKFSRSRSGGLSNFRMKADRHNTSLQECHLSCQETIMNKSVKCLIFLLLSWFFFLVRVNFWPLLIFLGSKFPHRFIFWHISIVKLTSFNRFSMIPQESDKLFLSTHKSNINEKLWYPAQLKDKIKVIIISIILWYLHVFSLYFSDF